MPEQKLRFGLIGAGAIANSYVQAFHGFDLGDIAAVADIRQDAAQALAETLHCKSYESYQAMAAENHLDAVIVCTPPVTHAEICIYFAERRMHILCEKPFTVDTKSAKAMLRAAEASGVRMAMASKFRYADDVIRAKSIVTSGILGEIVLFENAFTSRVDMSERWNSKPEQSGGGVLIDNGTHSLDIARYFLGPLAEVQVIEGKRSQGLRVDETVHVFVHSARGVIASIDLSWSINKELDSYINIYGSQGTVSVGWKESRYRQSSGRDWIVFGHGYNKVNAFRNQISNFAKAIRGIERMLITPEDALASVEAVEAAYESIARDHWTAIRPAGNSENSADAEALVTGITA
jgi:predicted dehydrogenase